MAKRPNSEKIDVEALRAALAAAELRADQAMERADEARAAADRAEAEAAAVKAQLSGDAALIAHLRLEIAKLTRTLYGQRSERTQRLIDQYELQLEELEASGAADALAAEKAAAKAAVPAPTERRRPSRQPFPAHLPRVRVVVPGPGACPCCGGTRLSKLGEDVTETLEVVPRRWTVIQTVRERFDCRACEGVAQTPAPFHAVPRGWAGPSLLAMVLSEKFGQHQPLNRQAERYAREGVPLSLSTLADQVGTCAAALDPLFRLIEAHVWRRAACTGTTPPFRCWPRARPARGGCGSTCATTGPSAAPIPRRPCSATRPTGAASTREAHLAGWTGVLQADACGGYGRLYEGRRKPAPIIEAACWAHARRKFFELADIEAAARQRARKKVAVIAPLALEAVRRMDELFASEREVNGQPTAERLAARHERSAPIVAVLEGWMRAERARLPRGAEIFRAMDDMLDRWPSFARFLDDGRVCLSNNAAERALRGLALGRKAWLFAGSDRGGQRAAFINSLIVTAKLNDVDPQARLADVLGRIAPHPAQRLAELLPWNWRPKRRASTPQPDPDAQPRTFLTRDHAATKPASTVSAALAAGVRVIAPRSLPTPSHPGVRSAQPLPRSAGRQSNASRGLGAGMRLHDGLETFTKHVQETIMPRPTLTDAQMDRLRERILAQAAQIVADQGYRGLTMRALAQAVGLTAGALYRYFPTKQHVMLAYCSQEIIELANKLKRIGDEEPDPLKALETMLIAYGAFALDNPDRFRVVFLDADLTAIKLDDEEALDAYGSLYRAVMKAREANLLRPLPDHDATRLLWAAAHGVCVLAVTIQEVDFSDASNLLAEAARNALRGLTLHPEKSGA